MVPTSNSQDVEAPEPVYAVPIVDEPQVEIIPSTPATIMYVRDNHEHQFQSLPDPNPGMQPCAIIGCLFSWIPFVGIVNFFINMNAPRNSKRRLLAQLSCCIASIILLFCVFNMLFWPFWT